MDYQAPPSAYYYQIGQHVDNTVYLHRVSIPSLSPPLDDNDDEDDPRNWISMSFDEASASWQSLA